MWKIAIKFTSFSWEFYKNIIIHVHPSILACFNVSFIYMGHKGIVSHNELLILLPMMLTLGQLSSYVTYFMIKLWRWEIIKKSVLVWDGINDRHTPWFSPYSLFFHLLLHFNTFFSCGQRSEKGWRLWIIYESIMNDDVNLIFFPFIVSTSSYEPKIFVIYRFFYGLTNCFVQFALL